MAYTTIDDPTIYFNTKLFSGTGSSNSVTGVGFAPNFVWLKKRNGTPNHFLFDTVRGVQKALNSNQNYAESTQSNALTAFGSDGFTVGSDGDVNGGNMVSWNWKAGSGTSTNTAGNGPDTTINVNQTAGFSIVTWTGNGDAHTFGHGLGANADVVIVKNRGSGSSSAWYVNHISVANTKTLFLNTTAAETTNGIWGNSAPDSTTFKFDTDNTDNFVAYCFAAKKGYSKFGSYVGNGNVSGSYIHLGFKPAFVMIKKTSGTGSWYIYDNKRDVSNAMTRNLFPDGNYVEDNNTNNNLDFLSNGFKIRTVSGARNASGGSYIYMAFAENPFVTSTGVPATAR